MRQVLQRILTAAMLLVGGAAASVAQNPQPAPPTLEAYHDLIGEQTFVVTGSIEGDVYGDGIYTTDSPIGTAAVHAGLVEPGQSRTLVVELLGPQESFAAATRNGVVSYPFGRWDSSFRFVDTAAAEQKPLRLPGPPVDDPGTLVNLATQVGELISFNVVGAEAGDVYGDSIYTADSVLARAAVHAGMVKPGESAIVTVQVLGPQDSFASAERNGVKTIAWGPFASSFRFVEIRNRQ